MKQLTTIIILTLFSFTKFIGQTKIADSIVTFSCGNLPDKVVVKNTKRLTPKQYNDIFKLSGNYRRRYSEKTNKKNIGWVYKREELLTLNFDSTYVIIRIQPLEGFEVLPDSGKWSINKSYIILKSNSVDYYRKFKTTVNGLIEPHRKEKYLSNVLWTKE